MAKDFSNYIKKSENKKCPFSDQKELLGSSNCPMIFDLGANKGQSTLKYAQTFGAAKIYSFEPYDVSYNTLVSNIGDKDNIIPVKCAVSNKNGFCNLRINKKKTTNSILKTSDEGKYWANKPSYMNTLDVKKVETIKLDSFCAKNKIPDINILKMDIQGAELLAVKGAEKLIKKGHIKIIYAEVSFVRYYEDGVLFDKLYAYLAKRGFTLYDLYDLLYASNGQIRRADALFVNKELSDNLFRTQKENISNNFKPYFEEENIFR